MPTRPVSRTPLSLIRALEPVRAARRPTECRHLPTTCWVVAGPAALLPGNMATACAACGGRPDPHNVGPPTPTELAAVGIAR